MKAARDPKAFLRSELEAQMMQAVMSACGVSETSPISAEDAIRLFRLAVHTAAYLLIPPPAKRGRKKLSGIDNNSAEESLNEAKKMFGVDDEREAIRRVAEICALERIPKTKQIGRKTINRRESEYRREVRQEADKLVAAFTQQIRRRRQTPK